MFLECNREKEHSENKSTYTLYLLLLRLHLLGSRVEAKRE